MNSLQDKTKIIKNNKITSSILDPPQPGTLISILSGSMNQTLLFHSRKKITVVVEESCIPSLTLPPQMEIYKWRNQTEFPIVKTHFIKIKDETGHEENNNTKLDIYTEHCPIRLSHIYEIALGQCLYLLKECIVGFQRLFNRFGGFDITENMIAVNEKGYCRVWLNENYSLNSYQKRNRKESYIVQKIINLIEGHSTETKASKKLFESLKGVESFLNALKQVQLFSLSSKTLVPSKFVFIHCCKTLNPAEVPSNDCSERRNVASLNKSCKKASIPKCLLGLKKESKRKLSVSPPTKIKRLRSHEKMASMSHLKTSDGGTTKTKKLKDTKLSSNFGSVRKSAKDLKWPQKMSQLAKKVKNGLAQSEAFQIEKKNYLKKRNRKYSIDVQSRRNSECSSQPHNSPEKNAQRAAILEFASILNDNDFEGSYDFRDHEPMSQKKVEEHTEAILKSNGWTDKFHQMFNSQRQVRHSIQQGQDEYLKNKELKLQKLKNLGCKELTMSILPEESQQPY